MTAVDSEKGLDDKTRIQPDGRMPLAGSVPLPYPLDAMPRPCCQRKIQSMPGSSYFKPAGIPLDQLEEEVLGLDEYEALRLADHKGLSQTEAAARMGISRQTFSRILGRARSTVARCLSQGLAMRIEGGAVRLSGRARRTRKA